MPSIPKISDVLGKKSMPLPEVDAEVEGDEPEAEGVSPEELDAMKMFEMAKSTEQKAEALKTFIKACMPEAY